MTLLINPYRFTDSSLFSLLTKLDLTTGLAVCLDAGDAASYSGSGQTWTDRSGNGNHYTRGNDSSATTDDPTFNGTAGSLADTAYWSFDAGDFFEESADQSFADTWGSDGALWSAIALLYPPSGGFANTDNIFQNGVAVTTPLFQVASNSLRLIDATDGDYSISSSNTFSGGAWNFAGVSVNENGGASGAFLRLQNTITTGNPAKTTPRAVSGVYRICASIDNTTRLSMIAIWNGVALTQAQMSLIYNALKDQRHTTLP